MTARGTQTGQGSPQEPRRAHDLSIVGEERTGQSRGAVLEAGSGRERPMGGRASLASRGRKPHPLPRGRAAQEEGRAATMMQVRGRGVGGGAGFGTAGAAATPCRTAAPSAPRPSGRRGLLVAAAAPAYLRGGEERQGASLRSGAVAAF